MQAKKSLTSKLLPLTPKTIWHRGEEYADDQLVSEIWQEKEKIVAHVYGTKRYLVKLTIKGQITGQCTCPYASSGEVCKHMVALAIVYDEHQGLTRPNRKKVETIAKDESPKFRSRISPLESLFTEPLKADLAPLRNYADFGKWVRPHAKLPPRPPMVTAEKPLTSKEVKRVFEKLSSWQDRSRYDDYFCAGEVTAALCEIFRVIFSRLPQTDPKEAIAIFVSSLEFYFQGYLAMIDGSDGIWQIAEAHLIHLHRLLLKRGMNRKSLLPFKKRIEKAGQGWGLTLEAIAQGNFL